MPSSSRNQAGPRTHERGALSSRAFAFGVALLLAAAYANHFNNGFHFDDSHAIQDNIYVRDIRNVPRYFVDATTFSVLPLNQSYRPLLQTTFAVDYWIAGGYKPFVFQIDTFVWYVALVAAMVWLFQLITADAWISTIAAAVYALHPVCAETVNYVVQRGDLLSTLGVVVALALYLEWPARRRFGLYLIPFAAAVFVKPPALVFPALLAAYVWVFQSRNATRLRVAPQRGIAREIAAAAALSLVLAWWLSHMTPPTATTGASDRARYLWSQPFVALRYFSMFFAPVGLSADNDWGLVAGPSDIRVAIGFTFVALLLGAIWFLRRKEWSKPAAFGLAWFVVALLPTSLTPLAEVANDHRMFFPFVGLALAAIVAARRVLETRIAVPSARFATASVLVAAIVSAEAVGVRARNEVWRSEETLWRDVTQKSPGNGRGWMNYGVPLMARGDYAGAVDAFTRAIPLTPNYHLLYINLGVAYGAVAKPAEAEQNFLKAIALEPNDWRSHLFYARWLAGVGRGADALAQARLSLELNPADREAIPIQAAVARFDGTPEYYLARSLAEYQMGRYRDCISSAEKALALRPLYAEAWNNIAAAHNALREWDQGIAAGEEALRINPALQIARNNLAYARRQKAQSR